MITLRYHFLTIVAIFLSLGLGIILGGSIGQNWINEKEQAMLAELEQKYDKAMQNNEELKQRINVLSMQMENPNKEFSYSVNSDYAMDLQGKKIGIWEPSQLKSQRLKQVLTSVGLEIIELGERGPGVAIHYPVIFIGEASPSWAKQVDPNRSIHLKQSPVTPSEGEKLLRNIQQLYKENKHEY